MNSHSRLSLSRPRCLSAIWIASLALTLACAIPASAQTPDNVAVVINENSSESVRIGEYYVRKRAIPAVNVLRIKTLTTETIERGLYAASIEGPIGAQLSKAGLQDRVLY